YGGKVIAMKNLKDIRKQGLNARLIRSLLQAGIICVAVYFVLYFLIGHALSYYFNHSDFEERHLIKQVRSLQSYVDKEQISSTNLARLTAWEKKQPLIFLELYHEGKCIYASPEQATDAVAVDFVEENSTAASFLYPVKLQDMDVEAWVYSDFFYQYYNIGTAVAFVVAVILFFILFLRSVRQLIQYICQLTDDMQIIEGGDLDHEAVIKGDDELTDLAKSMNSMRLSFKTQMQEEQKLYENNKNMITQMSHDLRTPLTSLMLYTDIVKHRRYKDESELQECLDKIDEKAHQIKYRSDHLFEYALAEHSAIQEKTLTCEQAFDKWIVTITKELEDAGFTVDLSRHWGSESVLVCREYLERIADNIVSNIIKYADLEELVLIRTINSDSQSGLFFSNGCGVDLEKADSHGVGLESIREMMMRMNGSCYIGQTNNRFELTLLFPYVHEVA
ncbi:MAG: HAMP domain-containing histidine kinase, partial [Lachnospiraceae bacterium]|nr:HAMP domain-containing histidine kinase [Lachnospiraceae bacterium]